MKLLRYVLFALSLFYIFGPVSIDNKDLEPHKMEIINIIKQHCTEGQYFHPRKQFLYFRTLPKYEIGRCFYNPLHLYYGIEIDTDQWKYATENQRFELFAHEVTHCALLLPHVDNPNNYMYYMRSNLSRETIMSQLLENIKRKCGK